MSYRDVQNLLDDNTEHLPEGLYLQLSRLLMEVHNSRSREIEEEMNNFAETITRTVIARSGDEVLNEIVSLRGEVQFLRDELLESCDRCDRLRGRIEMYKSQITSSSKKNEQYKKKIKELEVLLDLKEKNVVLAPEATTNKAPNRAPQCTKSTESGLDWCKVGEKWVLKSDTCSNPWILHVREWSKSRGVKYGQALKMEECRLAYRSRT